MGGVASSSPAIPRTAEESIRRDPVFGDRLNSRMMSFAHVYDLVDWCRVRRPSAGACRSDLTIAFETAESHEESVNLS
jgi:hypothetical protein